MLKENTEKFLSIVEALRTQIGNNRTVKIYIENYDIGYAITFSDFDVRLSNKLGKEVTIPNFISEISKINIYEYILYGMNGEVPSTDVNRNFHFIVETRMLIIDTYYREVFRSNPLYLKILDYSLFKHLNMYYNLRAKRQEQKKFFTTTDLLCAKFKGVYLATPTFTEAVVDGENLSFKDFHTDFTTGAEDTFKPLLKTTFEPINRLAAFTISMPEKKQLSVYSALSLLEQIKTLFPALAVHTVNFNEFADTLRRSSYKDDLFLKYWYPEILTITADTSILNTIINLSILKTEEGNLVITLTPSKDKTLDTSFVNECFGYPSDNKFNVNSINCSFRDFVLRELQLTIYKG